MNVRDTMMTGYPAGKSLLVRSRHVWDRYIGWGSADPLKRRAMRQLAVSDRITEESKTLVGDAFDEFNDMMRECAAGGAMRHQPPSFVSAIMSAIADTTMDFIAREPAQAKRYTKAGFDAFWNRSRRMTFFVQLMSRCSLIIGGTRWRRYRDKAGTLNRSP